MQVQKYWYFEEKADVVKNTTTIDCSIL